MARHVEYDDNSYPDFISAKVACSYRLTARVAETLQLPSPLVLIADIPKSWHQGILQRTNGAPKLWSDRRLREPLKPCGGGALHRRFMGLIKFPPYTDVKRSLALGARRSLDTFMT